MVKAKKRILKELIVPLPNGCTVRCGPGRHHQWGGYLRICDPNRIEIVYWDVTEWAIGGNQENAIVEGESVIGAVFNSALTPTLELLLESLNRTEIVGDHWE